MKTELDEILEFYENEKLALEKLIEDLVEEKEYKQAHIHQKALKKVNRYLFLFHNLENPNHTEIVQLQQTLEVLQKLERENPSIKGFLESRKHSIELQLQQLTAAIRTVQMDSQTFDEVIFDLVESKHSHFHFFLNTESNLYLDFKKVDQFITITIPKYKKLKKDYVLLKSNRNKLKSMGFKLTDDKKKLVFAYDISSFKDANPIKAIVSRVIYEGFGIHHIQNSSVIVIIS